MKNRRQILTGSVVIVASLLLAGCPDTSLLDLLAGAGNPSPGNNGIIVVESTDATSITVSWTAATDDSTAQADIGYQVYQAASSQIATPEDAAANGLPVFTAFETGVVEATISGLSPDTEYWIVVVARDGDGNLAAYNPVSATTQAAVDSTAPVPGNLGVITVTATDQTQIDISWTAARDETTADAAVEYQVYSSTADNIDTPSAAAANGDIVFPTYEAGVTAASIYGLTRATSYWVNVIARDEAGNMSAYVAEATATNTGPIIRVVDWSDTITLVDGTSTVDYGSVYSWAPVTKTFEIWNDGDQTLNLSAVIANRVLLTGDTGTLNLFYVDSQPANEAILPNNKETFSITFQSDSSWLIKNATATISSDDPANADFVFDLTAYADC